MDDAVDNSGKQLTFRLLATFCSWQCCPGCLDLMWKREVIDRLPLRRRRVFWINDTVVRVNCQWLGRCWHCLGVSESMTPTWTWLESGASPRVARSSKEVVKLLATIWDRSRDSHGKVRTEQV